jgi:O-methyltransferase
MEQPAKRRFSSLLPFERLTPFDELFFERVPLIMAVQIALANYRANRRRDTTDDQRASAIRDQSSNNRFWVAECGVFAGSALVTTGQLMRDFGIEFMLVGLDTFTGLPPLAGKDLELAPPDAPYRTKTLFTETSVAAVTERLQAVGLEKNAWLIEGLFKDTLPQLPDGQTYHFVNVDCDLYEPHIECLEYFYPRMEPGGVIFLDDYESVSYPMVRRAVDDFMTGKPEQLGFLRYGPDKPNHTKAFIIKE